MDRRFEHQLIEQLREVSDAADRFLTFFPNRTEVPALEELRHRVLVLKEQLYCDFCGTDQLLHPDHITQCPRCHGALHYHEDHATCEKCGREEEPVWPESLSAFQED